VFLASPIWFALLLPAWIAVAVWLFWSRRGERTDVPFLSLWRSPGDDSPRAQAAFRPPPLAIVAAMCAALLAIVASARPGISVPLRRNGPPITIILDRGLTMSVGDRRREVVNAAKPAILEAFGLGPTTFVPVPDGVADETDRSDWLGPAMTLPPTQEQTRDAVQFAVRQALAKNDGPVVVLSDQPLAVDDPRIVQIAPANPVENAGITRFALRESPQPQAMVTVANHSAQTRATLRLRSGEQRMIERSIELPERGGEASYFVDLSSLDAAAVAELDVPGDELPVDNIASAKRRHAFPAIEIRALVPPEVRRVAEAYAKTRPPIDASLHVAVTTDDRVPRDVPVAIVSTSTSSHGAGAVQVAAHPVSAGVDWADAKAQATGEPPDKNWRAIVSINDRAAVAIRDAPHRQVWIGFDAPDLTSTPDFVIFWTNVFDWLAGRDDMGGSVRSQWASNVVAPIDTTPPPASDWRAKLSNLKPRRPGATDLTSAVLLASVICLILAACAWPGRRLTAFSAPRTV
jgi:hypothetical protein